MRRSFAMGTLDKALCLFSELKRLVYRSSGGKCPEDYLYVMPIGGIGEQVLTCSQTHHLRKPDRPVCFIVRSDRFWMVRMWPESADLFIQVSPDQMRLLIALEDHSFLMPGHLYISYVTWLAGGNFADQLIMKEKLLGFREAFAFGLGLPLDSPAAQPMLVDQPVRWNPGPKSVLLMPNANFIRKMPHAFWTRLAADFLEQGYEVFCETFGSEPIDLPGVTNLQTEVLDFLALARRCSTVIMLRSGLSDLVSAHSRLLPHMKLIILWHLDPSTAGSAYELWHSPGCSVGYPSSKTWFGCGDNVVDVEVDPQAEGWRTQPMQQLLPYLPPPAETAPVAAASSQEPAFI